MTKETPEHTTQRGPASFWFALFLALTIGIGFGFARPSKITLTGSTMGTTYKIVIATDASLDQGQLKTAIDARLDHIYAQMSTWRDDSELSRFNASTSTDWFPVSADTQLVVAESLRIANESGGAFDPTVGPLVRLWNFGSAQRGDRIPPSDSQIAEARKSIGYKNVEVRDSPPAIRKRVATIELDLSGIAKGFAVDAISELLVERELKNHLVEIGGEMRGRGKKLDGSVWTIGIEKPTELTRELHTAIPLQDVSIATSGDYRNYYESDGKRYSHTIDPMTGKPIAHKLASVSIICESCMTADAWATGINVLGPERGLKLAQEKGLAALLLVRANGSFVESSTREFQTNTTASKAASPSRKREGLSVFGTIVAVMIVFAVAITGMAVGVIFSNRRIQGSCGGLANMPGHEGSACELCTNPAEECPERLAEQSSSDAVSNEKYPV
jgi:thiamine biosynthesis lipoprotein